MLYSLRSGTRKRRRRSALETTQKLDKLIDDYLESVTLKDLTHVQDGGDFVI